VRTGSSGESYCSTLHRANTGAKQLLVAYFAYSAFGTTLFGFLLCFCTSCCMCFCCCGCGFCKALRGCWRRGCTAVGFGWYAPLFDMRPSFCTITVILCAPPSVPIHAGLEVVCRLHFGHPSSGTPDQALSTGIAGARPSALAAT
jgi:hypothetical protein